MKAKKILIVDDEKDACEFLKDFFESKGFQAAVAHSGPEAVRLAESQKPEVILLDFQMPGMDGLQVLEAIRKLRLSSKIIMMTGVNESKTMEQALRLGAVHYVTKPFKMEYLFKEVQQILA